MVRQKLALASEPSAHTYYIYNTLVLPFSVLKRANSRCGKVAKDTTPPGGDSNNLDISTTKRIPKIK